MSCNETIFDIELGKVQDPRESRPQLPQRQPSRFITVDSVLRYASDVPSMQKRQPVRPRPFRTGSGHPVDPRLTGRYVPPPHMPQRSTKKTEKLVLLPESIEEGNEDAELGEDEQGPPKVGEQSVRRAAGEKIKSYAERLPKARRTEKELSRVTAYCTAQAYKLPSTAAFIRERHAARTKLYDDCLYVAYHLPLLQGTDGYRVASSPPVKGITGKNLLDEAIERSEQQDYHGAYFAEVEEQHSVRLNDATIESPAEHSSMVNGDHVYVNGPFRDGDQARGLGSHHGSVPQDALQYAEMFVLSYGVVVFWNFTERQEKDVLADLTFSTSLDPKTNLASPLGLATNPLEEEDFETEEFHFEYNNEIPRPRVYNDMITLRSGDHMIKLAISYAIAQSTKLSYFEEAMATQMEEAKDVPKRLALTGQLGMKREEVIKLMGGLFMSRVEINLCKFVFWVSFFIADHYSFERA